MELEQDSMVLLEKIDIHKVELFTYNFLSYLSFNDAFQMLCTFQKWESLYEFYCIPFGRSLYSPSHDEVPRKPRLQNAI